ncbi:MAG: hypothetical protein ABIR81_00425 [Ginsengibacter sp.]
MRLILVEDAESAQQFLDVPLLLYRQDVNYIRPLDKDVEEVFDAEKNKAFRHGKCIRWVLILDGKLIGRVAAFISNKYKNKGDEQPTGGVGFFECIDDQAAANILFKAAQNWLEEKGMQAMDGPINFGERDRWWGLVIEGFKPPIYLMNYNQPYYQKLFETYGFHIFYNQICWHLFVQTTLSDKFYQTHQKISEDKAYKAVHFKNSQLVKFAADFSTVYNLAWASHEGNKQISKEVAVKMFKAMKPVIDEKLIWYVYHNEKPIAVWLNLPDINQIVKRLNGKFDLWAKMRFAFYKFTRVCNKFTGIVFGIIPAFQGKGIDYYMIVEAAKTIQKNTKYNELELQWQGDFNPKMLNISKNLGAEKSRALATYRYLFDRNKPFKRHPILN